MAHSHIHFAIRFKIMSCHHLSHHPPSTLLPWHKFVNDLLLLLYLCVFYGAFNFNNAFDSYPLYSFESKSHKNIKFPSKRYDISVCAFGLTVSRENIIILDDKLFVIHVWFVKIFNICWFEAYELHLNGWWRQA